MIFFSLMTPRYKYRDKYFKAVIPFPTLTQSTTHCLGTFLGIESPYSFKAAGKPTRKTLVNAFWLNKYFYFFCREAASFNELTKQG
jgi:hypothetical protein